MKAYRRFDDFREMRVPTAIYHWADITEAFGKTTPDAIALSFRDRSITWKDMDSWSKRVAATLVHEGLQLGDRVAFLGRNSDWYFATLFAVARTGGIFVPVNWRLAPPEIAYILADCSAQTLIISAEFVPVFVKIRDKIPEIRRIVVVDGDDGQEFTSFERWIAQTATGSVSVVAGSPDDTVMLLYTSGTTGLPKGAELSSRYFSNALTNYLSHPEPVYRMYPGEFALITMPLFHVGGLMFVYVALAQGGGAILMEEFDSGEVLRLIHEQPIPFIPTVPTIIAALLDHPRAATTDFKNLRYCFYGAAPMPPALLSRALNIMQCDFVQLYGMTEAVCVTCLPPSAHDAAGNDKMLSVGMPLPGIQIRIVDPDGRLLGSGEVGEIEIKSNVLLKGYWNLPEATSSAFHSEWFRTGDAGLLDPDGYLFIKDRVKDMIISGGENIYPAEIESALYGHPSVQEAAVVGSPDAKWGEVPLAYIVTREGFDFEPDVLKTYLEERIARFKVPRLYRQIPLLPRNAAGKILKRELRKMAVE